MDEPLSNLDAKLRVQMRAEIAGIQRDLGVTTFYVTHDQVEAMTMGDRVAVIKDGVLQQVAAPEDLYEHPANVFVAAFIGSPSMNLYEGEIQADGDGYRVHLGDQSISVPNQVVTGRDSLSGRIGEPLVVGIRPEDLEDAAVEPEHPADQQLTATIDVREALGAETLLHFGIAAPHVDSGDPDALEELGDDSVSRCTARCSPRSTAQVGDTIQINVDASRLHFFDRTTHEVLT